jgi:hypothetical protein
MSLTLLCIVSTSAEIFNVPYKQVGLMSLMIVRLSRNVIFRSWPSDGHITYKNAYWNIQVTLACIPPKGSKSYNQFLMTSLHMPVKKSLMISIDRKHQLVIKCVTLDSSLIGCCYGEFCRAWMMCDDGLPINNKQVQHNYCLAHVLLRIDIMSSEKKKNTQNCSPAVIA